MEATGNQDRASPPSKPSKFPVYQNLTLSAALIATSLQPSKSTLLCIFCISYASALALLFITSSKIGANVGESSFQSYAKAAEVQRKKKGEGKFGV
ncbi:hypothetical protein V6N13_130192 [Hibiscus sabdariffa]|uniref:Uncharacterized protein n=1 Tax=Hibiscus sabdariffa TaxID=183260 RepID=A0ABR2SN92_9ROSI